MTSAPALAGEAMLLRLARRIVAFSREQMTPKAVALARIAFIDTLGVTLAGAAEECTRILLRTPGVAEAPGTATIFGTDRKSSMLDAALVNGTASHALDYDDFSQPMGGHQSVPLVSPLMAVAEDRGLSGEQLIMAYVVGIETEIRLTRAVNFYHYDKGWHPTATLGVFGGTAAVCHLLGIDEKRTAQALAIAASLAAGVKANFGTMTKPLHVGHCCRSALFAALITERGFTASTYALEHRQGFFNAFNGPGHYAPERLFESWGVPLEIESPTMGLKQFPCCGSTHSAISMALALVREEGLKAAEIRRVEILAHPRRLPHTDRPDPQTPLEAKFSIQYAVARALVNGAVRFEHFEGNAHMDPDVRAILAVTSAVPHPDMPDDAAEQFGAEVRVLLQDGRTLSRRIDGQIGRGGGNPMSVQELWEKFEDCSRRVLPRQDILPLFERLESLEKVENIRDMTRLMAKRSLPKPALAARPMAALDSRNTLLETSWVP
jgi:2-methylcitrate dehydratase PrpD